MKQLDVDETSQPSWAAAADAEQKNKLNKKLYSKEQQDDLIDLHDRVSIAYPNCRIFHNFRHRFMAVKVERPTIQDRVYVGVKNLDNWANKSNVEIVRTKTAVIYRILRRV